MALGSVAVALTALGRLSDSLEPQRAGLEAVVARKDWCNAARVGCELVNTLLTLGRVTAALDVAGLAVTHADLSGDDGQRADRRTNLAAVLVAIGDSGRAAALLVEAEGYTANSNPIRHSSIPSRATGTATCSLPAAMRPGRLSAATISSTLPSAISAKAWASSTSASLTC